MFIQYLWDVYPNVDGMLIQSCNPCNWAIYLFYWVHSFNLFWFLKQPVRSGRVQYVPSGSGLKARIRHFQNYRHEEKLAGQRHAAAAAATAATAATAASAASAAASPITGSIYTSTSNNNNSSSSSSVAIPLSRDKLTTKNRLKVCEGAVQSKLPIFDKRVKPN